MLIAGVVTAKVTPTASGGRAAHTSTLSPERDPPRSTTPSVHHTTISAIDHYSVLAADFALAEELSISHQALSERLRRAHHTLIEEALTSPLPERGTEQEMHSIDAE